MKGIMVKAKDTTLLPSRVGPSQRPAARCALETASENDTEGDGADAAGLAAGATVGTSVIPETMDPPVAAAFAPAGGGFP